MSEGPESAGSHRELGVRLYNEAWSFIDKPDRTGDDDVEMLLTAAASRWHWAQVGGPEELANGDWQVAHAASLLGFGDLALMFARRHLATAEREGWDGWRLACAHEGFARASAAAGNWQARDRHVAAAAAALDREPDEEDRAIIAGQLASVPRP